ncbi:hypothetical protein P5V15_009241 [Pogonomyrmex californicus]
MSGCSAPFCNNSSKKSHVMKVFPRNPKRQTLWLQNIGHKNWMPTNDFFLCEICKWSLKTYCNCVSFYNLEAVRKRTKLKRNDSRILLRDFFPFISLERPTPTLEYYPRLFPFTFERSTSQVT